MKTISYAITVCDEHVELEMLLGQLNISIANKEQCEVIILKDIGKTSEHITRVINKYVDKLPIKVFERKFDNDFSEHKNFLFSNCTKDYIFNIDADEIPSSILIKQLQAQLELNNYPDLMLVARINIVKGLTQQLLKKWNWHIDDKGMINFPDWQGRIIRNSPDIKWIGKVHERIDGAKIVKYLPQDEKMAFLHVKEIARQIQQNNFYETLI
ncbi:glycosyltransferase [Candidatus Gracilibacteria bacterium]|jgi:hypothetical protein|nr:glycosyltransferase [Candidatus Gracilibacteria bacterium]